MTTLKQKVEWEKKNIHMVIVLFTRLSRDSLEYYLTLQNENHRDAWTNVLTLLLTKFLKLDNEHVWMKLIS